MCKKAHKYFILYSYHKLLVWRKGCVNMQQTTMGNDEARMCRQDKIVLSILALNILIVLIWAISLNLGPTAKNTERKKANTNFFKTETLQMQANRVEPKESYVITPIFYSLQEEIVEVTTSWAEQTQQDDSIDENEKEVKEFSSAYFDMQKTISESVARSVKNVNKKAERAVEQAQKTTTTTTTTTIIITTTEEPTTEAIIIEELTEAEVYEEVYEETYEEVPAVEEPTYVEEYVEPEPITYTYSGPVLTAWLGTVQGPSGKETYYNLDMGGVISIMNSMGYSYSYWIREDGCKMFGDYIMCAANLDVHPRGSLVETSLGTAIVCDTGGFAYINPYQVDIATTW